MLNDTLLGFKTLAASATERTLVVWINEYFGPVEREGKSFSQMQVYLENQDKVVASVGIRERARDTFGKSIQLMRENKLTFGEAIGSARIRLDGPSPAGNGPGGAFDQTGANPVRMRPR